MSTITWDINKLHILTGLRRLEKDRGKGSAATVGSDLVGDVKILQREGYIYRQRTSPGAHGIQIALTDRGRDTVDGILAALDLRPVVP